jgi:hypothetical protein
MINGDLRDQIARLEADFEQLTETLAKCRKVMLVSQIVVAAGAIGLLAYLFGAVTDSTIIVGAIAAFIGGAILFGSNSSTWKEAAAALRDAEALRTKLIVKIKPHARAGDVSADFFHDRSGLTTIGGTPCPPFE